MLQLNESGLRDRAAWEEKGYILPAYDRQKMIGETLKAPRWIHFGAGNIFRAFQCNAVQRLLDKGSMDTGIIAAEGFDYEIVEKGYRPNGNYSLLVTLHADGSIEKTVIGSIAASYILDSENEKEFGELKAVFRNPALQIASFTITEKGYSLVDGKGELLPDVAADFRAGPARPRSYIGKVASLLYARYQAKKSGLVILSCELIDHNGDELKRCVNEYIRLWEMEEEFRNWVNEENIFCSTLVDLIVTGSPKGDAPAICEKLGYEDQLIDTGELFAAWVIEGPQSIKEELPFEKAGLPIQVVDDVTPYKQRKVRILNGAHTSMVLGAYLAGKNIVRDCMQDENIRAYLNKAMFEEIIPTLDLPKEELSTFAASVIDRFDNPYIDHQLLDISLNSASKWKARVMPSVTEYVKRKGELPHCLTFSFAAFIAFYHQGERNGEAYPVRDDAWVLEFFNAHKEDTCDELAHAVVNNEKMWGRELAELSGFEAAVANDLRRIEEAGMYEAMRECLA